MPWRGGEIGPLTGGCPDGDDGFVGCEKKKGGICKFLSFLEHWKDLSKKYSIKAPANAVHGRFGQPTWKALNLKEGFVDHEWLIGTFHGKSNVLMVSARLVLFSES